MKTSILLSASVAVLALSSCEVTGDPRSGGIFWSSRKAQQRLDDRQNTLDGIQRDTRAINRNSAYKQQKIDRLR